MTQALLKVENLRVELKTKEGTVPVIDDISFELNYGESLSFVGESGCGKSMTALAIMGLLPEKISKISSGRILFEGQDLTRLSTQDLRKIRGNKISMIFQEPMSSLNPVYSIGAQITEVLKLHQNLRGSVAWRRAEELLDAVKIPDPKRRIRDYPFQMSGGQRQRVMIAMALACKPKILIADEPTTALDVTVQAQIFELLNDLKTKTGCENAIKAVEKEFENFDTLIFSAGATKSGDFLKQPIEDFEDGFALKFYSAVRLSKAFWPTLSKNKGWIVSINGAMSHSPDPFFMVGGAVNAAFLNFTKALSKRGLVDGVNVNSINPGMTSTDRLITIIQNNADREGISFVDAEKNALKNIGLDRFSTPEEVAELAYFLCDPKVRHLTGTEINLDGGKKPTI